MIAEFYKDSEIFFTGGSGAVGKAAIEKILRSCEVRRIYILLRGKNNRSVDERLERLKQSKIFRVLKDKKPNELDKLEAIPGDAMLPKLGITSSDAKKMENVSIFFHCAATVLFNEPLWKAICLNVGGTLEALKFATNLKQLKAFVHVSTYFSNPYLTYVEPKLYPPPMDWKLMLKLAQDENERDILNALTKKIIQGFPNTYCFSKNLAENVVNEYGRYLPVVIYRPSIVIFALSEPEPGFPTPLVGAMGLFVLACAGLLKCVYTAQGIHLDLTPLDMGTIVMLTTTAMSAEEYKAGKILKTPVYMFSCCNLFPFSLKEIADCLAKNELWELYAYEKGFLIPGTRFVSSKILYQFLCFVYQVIPATLADGLLIAFGRKPILMSIVRRFYVTLETMEPFLFNNYQSDGITRLDEMLDITDGTEFAFREYINVVATARGLYQSCLNMVIKTREVLLNEDFSTLDRARKLLKM